MNTLKAALSLCGLSHAEAAEYLSLELGRIITKNTIDDMARGKTRLNIDILEALAGLFARIEEVADNAADMLEPGLIAPENLNGIQVDDGADPLPDGSDDIAGALALFFALADRGRA